MLSPFSRSSGRAGKPAIKWIEVLLSPSFSLGLDYFFVISSFSFSGCITPIIIIILQVQSWFQDRLQECTHKVSCPPNVSKELCVLPETFPSNKLHESSQMPEGAIFFFSFSYRI